MTNFVFNNFGNTTLAAPLSSSGTTMTIASAANYPTSIPGGFVLAIELNDAATGQIYEIVYATAISGTTVSGLLRGQEGTTAQNWNVNDRAFTGPTAAMFASIAPTNTGSTGSVGGGLKIVKLGSTQIGVTALSAALVTTGGGPFFVAPVNVTISCATNGANGLDTGSLAASTVYYMWLISNGSGVAGLASLSSTAPVFPAGYTYAKRVGAMITDGSANFWNTEQLGNETTYIVSSGNTPNLPIPISGIQGSVSVPTWAAASVSSFVPPTAAAVMVVLFCSAGIGGANRTMAAPNSSYGAASSVSNPPPLVNWPAENNSVNVQGEFVVETVGTVYYASEVANAGLAIKGWRDNL